MNFNFDKNNTRLSALKAVTTSLLVVAGLTAAAQNQLPGKVHFGVIYPLSTNGTHAPLDTNNLSINLIAGLSSAERGLSFAGFSNVVRNDTKGAQFAGFSNHIGKMAQGALFAGFMNTYGEGQGIALAGFANITRNMKGAQFAGFMNIAKEVSASQAAGFINKATDIKGSQFAGFINIAKKVKGLQVAGFINVADSSDFPIGIVNIVKNGEKSIGITTDENLTTIASLRSGGKVLYGIIGIGYNFNNDEDVYAFEAGLGAHLLQSKIFRVNAEMTAGALQSFEEGEYFKSSVKLMPALKITPFLEIFAGPSLNFITTNTFEGRTLQKKYIKKWDNDCGDNFKALYAGYTGGIHVIF